MTISAHTSDGTLSELKAEPTESRGKYGNVEMASRLGEGWEGILTYNLYVQLGQASVNPPDLYLKSPHFNFKHNSGVHAGLTQLYSLLYHSVDNI